MNRFVIFGPLALFCLLFVPAQADGNRQVYRKIKTATVVGKRGSQTFDKGNASLFKTVQGSQTFYEVGDNSSPFSREFEIDQENVSVTEKIITIKFCDLTITLTLESGEDTFKFYGDLFSLDNSDHKFPVSKVTLGTKILSNVTDMITKKVGSERIFAAVSANGKPRLIFPRGHLQKKSLEGYALVLEPTGEKISIEFVDNSTSDGAKTFYDLVRSPPQ